MYSMGCTLLSVVLLLSLLSEVPGAALYHTVVGVDPGIGVDNSSCLPPDPTHACLDINYALSHKEDSVQYELEAGTKHYLDIGVDVFLNVHDVALVSSNDSEVSVVQCRPGAGLAFDGSTNIVISNIRFLYCGALRNSTSKNFSNHETFSLRTFNVTLYFYQCASVTLDRVAVVNSTDATGVVIYDTVGMNNISHSNFSGNPIPTTKSDNVSVVGGGGFAIEFTYCKPGDNNCSNHDFQPRMNTNASYLFDSCTFQENRAYGQRGNSNYLDSAFFNSVKEKHQAFGRGGGLSLYFKGNATDNHVVFKDCYFIHNHADWGGGLLIEFDDDSLQNTVEIKDTQFCHNYAVHVFKNDIGTGGGGGVRIASYVNSVQNGAESHVTASRVNFTHCNFTNNKAWNGGGISISFALQEMDASKLTTVAIKDSIFEENSACLGFAIEVALFPMFRAGKVGKITVSDCVFTNNHMQKNSKLEPYYRPGLGAVYAYEISVFFNSTVRFQNNSGTAIAIAGATLHFENCDATFVNNTGKKGGAIALLGTSNMAISNLTNMTFISNNGTEYGGAIYNRYISQEDQQSYINCFIQYNLPLVPPENWGAHFKFCNNSAGLLGKSIYTTSILPCTWSSTREFEDVKKVFHWNYKWDYCGRNESDLEISSEQNSFNYAKDTTVQLFPGQTVRLNISALNELGEDITNQTAYLAAIKDSNLLQVKPEYTYVSAGYFAVTGEAQDHAILGLDTSGAKNWHIDIKLEVLKCPPGMKLMTPHTDINETQNTQDNVIMMCGCSKDTFRNKFDCSADTFTTKIKNSYWIGKLHANSSDDELYVGECPYRYCNTNDEDDYFSLPNRTEDLESKLCKKHNRRGVLCGECIEGYANAINSYQFPCVQCNSSNGTNIGKNVAIYLVSTYLPIILFLILIICFNIRLTTGPVNAYILFAQVISVNMMIDIPIVFDASHVGTHSTYAFLYGIFNLNFFSYLLDPFCVNENFNTLDVLLLDYCVAAFPLVMIVVVIAAIRLKDCCSWRCDVFSKWKPLTSSGMKRSGQKVGVALAHALVAFMLLSYTKFSAASTFTLATTVIYGASGDAHGFRRSYFAGKYSLSDSKYLSYWVPSLLVFVFIVAIPPLLLLGPLNWFNNRVSKYRILRKLWPQDKVHIILDTFQGCFKPKMRFFSGVYFLFRLALCITYAFTADFFQQYIIQQILLMILLSMLALFQPYQKPIFNCIDTLVILNLGIINALSVCVVLAETKKIPGSVFYLQNILIYIPIFCLLCYITLLVLNKSKFKAYHNLKAKVVAWFPECFKEKTNGRLLITHNNYMQPLYESLSDDSLLLARANEPNTFRKPVPTQMEVERGRDSDGHSPNSDRLSSGIYSGGNKPFDEKPTMQ